MTTDATAPDARTPGLLCRSTAMHDERRHYCTLNTAPHPIHQCGDCGHLWTDSGEGFETVVADRDALAARVAELQRDVRQLTVGRLRAAESQSERRVRKMTESEESAQPMGDAQLDAMMWRANNACSYADYHQVVHDLRQLAAAWRSEHAEVERLRGELAEERASRNPLLRCILVKAAPDRDLYIGWSNVVEAPTGAWTRAEAIAYGFPPSRLDRADRNGTSSRVPGSGQWDDHGFIAEQRGWLRRDRIADYAQALFADDENAAWDLLEPFEGETEVRRG